MVSKKRIGIMAVLGASVTLFSAKIIKRHVRNEVRREIEKEVQKAPEIPAVPQGIPDPIPASFRHLLNELEEPLKRISANRENYDSGKSLKELAFEVVENAKKSSKIKNSHVLKDFPGAYHLPTMRYLLNSHPNSRVVIELWIEDGKEGEEARIAFEDAKSRIYRAEYYKPSKLVYSKTAEN